MGKENERLISKFIKYAIRRNSHTRGKLEGFYEDM